MRIYAPDAQNAPDSYYSLLYGHFVVATSHLDFRDSNGCNDRRHGYSEVGENWFIGTMSAVPGWSVCYGCWGPLWNTNVGHEPVFRNLGGVDVPHIYDNDWWGTYTWVP